MQNFHSTLLLSRRVRALGLAAMTAAYASISAGDSFADDAAPTTAATTGPESSAAQKVNESNNPLNPAFVVNIQDYYIPRIKGYPDDASAEVTVVRKLVPFRAFGRDHLLRSSTQWVGLPQAAGGRKNGMGDTTVFDIVIMQEKPFGWGVGPLIVAPTAKDNRFGTGRWQLGGAGAVVVPTKWGLTGALVTYQQTVTDDEKAGRKVSTITAQPFLFRNLPHGYYIQSSGAWTFDLRNDTYYIPIGVGVGKHWQLTKDFSINTYIEPQYVVASKGLGVPKWQTFAGLNLSYSVDGVLRRLKKPPLKPRS